MHTCIKTGCHAYLEQYGEYVYGDAFIVNGNIMIRAAGYAREPMNGLKVIHIWVSEIAYWWDKETDSATIACDKAVFLSYEGEKINEKRLPSSL